MFGVNLQWWQPTEDLSEVAWLGNTGLARDEKVFADRIARVDVGVSFSTLRFVNFAAEGEWRWQHDRDALEVENAKVQAEALAERKAQQERYETRLKGLTWDQLLADSLCTLESVTSVSTGSLHQRRPRHDSTGI